MSTSTVRVRAVDWSADDERVTLPTKVRSGICGTVILASSPSRTPSEAFCGTWTSTRSTSSSSTVNIGVPVALSALTSVPRSTLRTVTTPSKGASTSSKEASAFNRSIADPCALTLASATLTPAWADSRLAAWAIWLAWSWSRFCRVSNPRPTSACARPPGNSTVGRWRPGRRAPTWTRPKCCVRSRPCACRRILESLTTQVG